MKINLILADDHPAVLAGLESQLISIPTLEIVGAAANSTELYNLLNQVSCDILIADYAMPGGEYGDGMTLLSFIRRQFPDLMIILFTSFNNPLMINEIAKIGIRSLVSKSDDIHCLISAIHMVYAGASYFSPSIAISQKVGGGQDKQLTKREMEVLRLFVSGMSINEIADQFKRSKQTISSQKGSAMRKLKITRDSELFQFAREAGLTAATEIGASVFEKKML